MATYTILPADSAPKGNDTVPPANLGSGEKIRHFKWGPVGNALVYVDQNKNIIYRFDSFPLLTWKDIYFRSEAEGTDIAVTKTGGDFVYHGISDWV